MAINYQSSFNGGELSRKMEGRSDLDVYKSGCSLLQNFFVLPQGGIERRPGWRLIGNTGLAFDGAEPARMIPFTFSADESYTCEIGNGYIRVWEDDSTYYEVTGTVPYLDADLTLIDYYQRFDVLFLGHPEYPIQLLKRTSLTPTFEIEPIAFDYPPFLDKNTDAGKTLRAAPPRWVTGEVYEETMYVQVDGKFYICTTAGNGQTATVFATDLAAGWWIQVEIQSIQYTTGSEVLIQSVGVDLSPELVDSTLLLQHPLSESKVVDSGRLISNQSSDAVFIGTGNTYRVSVTNKREFKSGEGPKSVIEVSTDGTAWVIIETLDSKGTFTFDKTMSAPRQYVRVRETYSNSWSAVYYEIASSGNRRVTANLTANGTTSALDVSFCKWTVFTGGLNWNGVVEVERSTDGGASWESFIIIADTIGMDPANFSYSSPSIEGGNTFIRVKYTSASPIACEITIKNESSYTQGLVEVTEYVSPTEVKGIVLNPPSSAGYTKLWAEESFSGSNGYPSAMTFYEDRLWLAGSNVEPSTVYGSVAGNYYTFLGGSEDDLGIRRIPDSPEEARWLIGRRTLFMGTEGGAITISSADSDSLITASNIKTDNESVYGTSKISAILANDVVLYIQRNGLKLREMVYTEEQGSFVSNDLTIMNDDILEGKVTELFLQSQPDQMAWCIRGGGEASVITYERQQNIIGWGRIATEGDIISGCVRPSELNEDDLWLCVKRNGKYLIERAAPRADLNRYVDSYVELIASDALTVASASKPDTILLTVVGHDYLNGDFVTVYDSANEDLDYKVFEVSDVLGDDFKLYLNGQIPIFEATDFDNASVREVYNELTGLDHLEGLEVQFLGNGIYTEDQDVASGKIVFVDEYYSELVAGLRYDSIMRTMPVEPILANRLSQSRAKATTKAIIKFHNTIGAKVGEVGKSANIYPALSTTDNVGEPLGIKSAEQRVFFGSDWETEKKVEITQDLPYPMTVLSLALWVNVQGG